MTPTLDRVTNIVLLFTCLVLSVFVGLRLWNDQVAPPAPGRNRPEPVEDIASREISINTTSLRLDNPSAITAVMVEFTDFQCPFCGVYARDTFPELKRDYVSSGKLKYVIKHLPLPMHPFAPTAARASYCAEKQDRLWDMHHELFTHQEALSDQDLLTYATKLGLNQELFSSCLSDKTTAAAVDADVAEAKRLRVNSTPTFFVGSLQDNGTVRLLRQVNGAQAYRVFQATLDDVLKTVR